jgi:putative Mn2+ efflux pump MntP
VLLKKPIINATIDPSNYSIMVLFLEAFILALASSTDNFMVGLSVGITNRHLSLSVNSLISICNASGALLASMGGKILGENLPSFVSPLLSAITFGGLALQESLEFIRTVQREKKRRRQKQQRGNENNDVIANDNFSDISNSSSSCNSGTRLDISRALQLAFPMTLNNLAGGVAGTWFCHIIDAVADTDSNAIFLNVVSCSLDYTYITFHFVCAWLASPFSIFHFFFCSVFFLPYNVTIFDLPSIDFDLQVVRSVFLLYRRVLLDY